VENTSSLHRSSLHSRRIDNRVSILSGSSSCTNTTRNNVYLTNGSVLYQFTPATLAFSQVATINCSSNGTTLYLYSIALQRNGLLWLQMTNSKLYTYNISTGQCADVALPLNQSDIRYGQIAFAKNTTDNSESLYVSYDNTLKKLDTNSLTVSVVGNYTNGTYGADIAGSNDGKLYGLYFLNNQISLSQIDQTTAQSLSNYGLPITFDNFFYYLTYFPYLSNFILLHGNQNTTRVILYNAATNTTTNQTTLSTGELSSVAVSTCLGT
jgi:hypothetical protein